MKSIGILVGIGVAGVFVGAFAMEVIHRTNPSLIKNFQESTKKTFADMGNAFKQGYADLPLNVEESAEG